MVLYLPITRLNCVEGKIMSTAVSYCGGGGGGDFLVTMPIRSSLNSRFEIKLYFKLGHHMQVEI